MNLAMFEKMTPEEARELLRLYLDKESAACASLAPRMEQDGVVADFSPDSVPSVFQWALKSVRTVPLESDLSEPEWVRSTPSYAESLFDFDEESKQLVLTASYYFGESFVRTYPNRLAWGIGNSDFATANQHVVQGFMHDLELSTVMVTESLFARIVKDAARLPDVDKAVQHWKSMVRT